MRFWRCSRTLAIVAIFAFTLCATSQGPEISSPSAASRSFANRVTIKGVSNAGEVTPLLYRGAQPTAQGFDSLAKMGINIVVDLRGSRQNERERVNQLGMQYVAIPWHCPFPHDDAFARFLALLRENPGKKVFVHCRLGDDRAGMTVAAYRMAEEGWTAPEAMKEMQAYGFSSSHHVLCPGLSSYESSFPRRFSTSPVFHSLRASPPSPAQ